MMISFSVHGRRGLYITISSVISSLAEPWLSVHNLCADHIWTVLSAGNVCTAEQSPSRSPRALITSFTATRTWWSQYRRLIVHSVAVRCSLRSLAAVSADRSRTVAVRNICARRTTMYPASRSRTKYSMVQRLWNGEG